MIGDIYAVARNRFNFLYASYSLSNNGEPFEDPNHYLAAATAFLNGRELLELARRLMGFEQIQFAEGQATRFRPERF